MRKIVTTSLLLLTACVEPQDEYYNPPCVVYQQPVYQPSYYQKTYVAPQPVYVAPPPPRTVYVQAPPQKTVIYTQPQRVIYRQPEPVVQYQEPVQRESKRVRFNETVQVQTYNPREPVTNIQPAPKSIYKASNYTQKPEYYKYNAGLSEDEAMKRAIDNSMVTYEEEKNKGK